MSVIQINAQDAFERLKKDQNSILIDVRTFEEFNFVGIVNAAQFNNRMTLLPWQILPNMNENPDFAVSLEKAAPKKDVHIFFLCRSGARSSQAANYATNLGYENCYNITSGFEGDLDQDQQRGKINGWKANNLPWRQK